MRTNAALQRDLLGAAILRVRSGRAVSRASLATALGVAPSTVGLYVDQLIADGYVDESGLARGAVGRPQRTLATLPGAGWFAGVEFNAERVQAVRVDFAGNQVASQIKPLPEETDVRTVLQTIKNAIAALAKGGREPLLAIGVGAPGIVDPDAGVSSHYAFIPGWSDVPLAGTLGERFDVPVILENNLRAIALAERWFGGGRDLDHYVILGPRSGFGIAVVQNGAVLQGAHHAAGEIGRWSWPPGKGAGRELQDALSAPAVWRRLAEVSPRTKLPENLRGALAKLADSSGPAWDGVIADFAQVIALLELTIDTEAFFLHGPLTTLGERFCRCIEQEARAGTPALAGGPLKIMPSALGDDAGALGAASLAMEAWAPTLRE